MTKTNGENKDTIFVGDLNCNYLNTTTEKPMKELLILNSYSMCKRSRLTEDFVAYEKQRNKVNISVRKAKSQHKQNLLTEA